ncbi:DNA modification methylase [Planctomycetales bacterium]|nr:DNA modification methylase [Planctomycetales bacterium]
MKYQVVRNTHYDFLGQSYATFYPNLHRYPATMLPQIGIDILKEFGISKGRLLDPYCGSGSSFASGLECGLTDMVGYDLNPLAVLISKVRFTKISVQKILDTRQDFRNTLYELMKDEKNIKQLKPPVITNINFWFSPQVVDNLKVLKHCIETIQDANLQNFFLIPFSETVRDCSYTRNCEFKLYRMKPEDCLNFNPDVIGVFFKKLEDTVFLYMNYYFTKLEKIRLNVFANAFQKNGQFFDVVLTSPPYGDSRTTVAYGQFSTFANEWLGVKKARALDRQLMGGNQAKFNITEGLIADYIAQIRKEDKKRALDVSAFYRDLESSIKNVAGSIKKGGKAIYVVGNRTVKKIQLPTDQFIAEKFEENGFKHLITYERAISNKAMPSKNSPTNISGKTMNTMLSEFIVVCEKKR